MAPNVISISKTAYVSAGMLQFYIRMNNVNVLAIVVGLQMSAAWYMAVTAAKQGYWLEYIVVLREWLRVFTAYIMITFIARTVMTSVKSFLVPLYPGCPKKGQW